MILLHHVIRPVGAATAALAIILLSAGSPRAHDHYMQVYERNALGNRLCCGGDPHTGDCEPVVQDDVHEAAAGIFIVSRRYSAQVFVPMSRVHWDSPRKPDGTLAFPDDPYAAHWCGKPRSGSTWPVTEQDPDPSYTTFCFFMRPGGV